MGILYFIFALSGAASLIYEVVWFQLLHLTIGVDSGSLGIVLACFMGGLFIGSFGYARWVPARWNPLRTYALMEAVIGLIGFFLPTLLSGVRESYLAQAADPRIALLLRCIISAGLLMPPTILMGATLPALSRWIKADDRQVSSISQLYASNIIGAVLGAFGAAFFLMPRLEFLGANMAAVVLNGCIALLSLAIRDGYQAPKIVFRSTSAGVFHNTTPVYLAYALNGAASLAFEVLWSRMLGMAFGATVYAFAMVLGVFLLALGLGGSFGTWLIRKVDNAKQAFAVLQVGIAAMVSSTAVLVPFMAFQFSNLENGITSNAPAFNFIYLFRTIVVVFPGAFLWGMSFPFALSSLGKHGGDAAKPVGYLYAYNTVGSVAGSLGASFLLLPLFGSTTATAHLVILPLAAAAVLFLPAKWPGWTGFLAAAAALVLTFLTPVPSLLSNYLHELSGSGRFMSFASPLALILLGIPAVVFSKFRRKSWVPLLVPGVLLQAFLNPMPPQLYMLGYDYAHLDVLRNDADIEVFQEGSLEPVVVWRHPLDNTLHVSINGKTCASSRPDDMQTQILLGLIPVLFSSDPQNSIAVGLGAGITAGSVTLSDAVKRVSVIELEPKVEHSARAFARYNHDLMDNPKLHLVIDDGRHYIASSREKFGIITSDCVDPWMAGAAALFTSEYFRQCRNHLTDGGVFIQWLPLYEQDKDGLKSILAAFVEAFPEGDIWLTPVDALLVGSTRKITIDVAALKKKISNQPALASELQSASLPDVEHLLAQYLCSSESLKEFLRGSPVNRDGNLYAQFAGGARRSKWNHPELLEMMWSLRKWDPDRFVVSKDRRADFDAAIKKQQTAMDGYFQQVSWQYRQLVSNSKR